MRGHAILTAAAERADPERAVAMLAEAAIACFYAGDPAQMLSAAERAGQKLPASPSVRARFLAAMAAGMARILGGDAAAGAEAVHEAVTLAENSAELRDDLRLMPWLALGPLFLRETGAGRPLLEHALRTARARAAVGALPFALNLIARDQVGTDRWAAAAATYQEAIDLARESGQQTELAFGLAGLAWLQARRGREQECRACAAEALSLCHELGMGLCEIWATAALGELELGLGDAGRAAGHFEHQQQLLRDLAITDADLSPAAELTDAYLRLGRDGEARQAAARVHRPSPAPRDSRGHSPARCAAGACSPRTPASRTTSSRRCCCTSRHPMRSRRPAPGWPMASGCAEPGTGCSPASNSARPQTRSSAWTPAPGPIAPAPNSRPRGRHAGAVTRARSRS